MENKSQPKVSMIICCYTLERLNDIYEAVESISAQTLKPHEIIISVDHNEDLYYKLQSELAQPAKVVLNSSIHGLSETRNAGIRAATGDIVAFIDDDAVAEPDWLEKLVEPFQLIQKTVVAVGGRALPVWPNDSRPSWFPEELDWIVGCTYKGLPLNENEVRNVHGCNMAFRKSIFDEVGFFNSDIGRNGKTKGVAEEPELCLRIQYSMPQASIIHKPDAVIHHKVHSWRLSLKYFVQRSYNEGFYKSIIEKLFLVPPKLTPSTQSTQETQALSTENSYLRYLLSTAIPRRIRSFYKKRYLLQTGAIIISMIATGVGYMVGRVRT